MGGVGALGLGSRGVATARRLRNDFDFTAALVPNGRGYVHPRGDGRRGELKFLLLVAALCIGSAASKRPFARYVRRD